MTWKSIFINNLEKNNYKLVNENIVPIWSKDITDSLAISFHKNMPKGAALRELRHTHLHLSYWETPYCKKSTRGAGGFGFTPIRG